MEQQYKTDAEIYAVLEREIIDLTIRPGSSLSENPLCARFGAPRSLIRVVLQKWQENGLVRIVPYKGTTVTRLNRRIVDELIYERTAVEARVLRDFSPRCTPEQRALIRRRVEAYEALAAVLDQVIPQHPGGRQLRVRRTGNDRAVLLDELRRGGFALGAAILHGVSVLTLGHLTAQCGGSCRGAGIDHQPGHTGVQPVHHPHKGVGCLPVRPQRGGHALLTGKPGGLVQHHKGGVLV